MTLEFLAAVGHGRRMLSFGGLTRAAILLADEGRTPDQPELMPGSPEDGKAEAQPADPFADYYRQEADPSDPCLD